MVTRTFVKIEWDDAFETFEVLSSGDVEVSNTPFPRVSVLTKGGSKAFIPISGVRVILIKSMTMEDDEEPDEDYIE